MHSEEPTPAMNEEAIAELIHRELVKWRAEWAQKLHREPEKIFLSIDTKVTALERQIAKAICDYLKDENR